MADVFDVCHVHINRQDPLPAKGTSLGRCGCLPAKVGERSMAGAMTSRVRKPVASLEATQQRQPLVELVRAPTTPPIRQPALSQWSMAPVGLDLQRRAERPEKAAAADEQTSPMMEIPLPRRHRHLGVFLVGALSACAFVLVVALVGRMVHASAAPPSGEARPSSAEVTAPSAPAAASPASPPPTAASVASTLTSAAGPSTGTVHLDRLASPGRVWLDGKKISAGSAIVSCGTHQIRVGLRRTHSIDVPCGGEVTVAK